MYAIMMTSVLFTLVVFLGGTLAQFQPEGSKSTITLLEVRKKNRPSTSYSQDHNVRFVFNQHSPLTNLNKWKLTVVREGDKQSYYEMQAEDPYPKEVEFEADLTDSTSLFIEGKDLETTIASSYILLQKSFMSSRVARVGTKYEESESSLRVWPGDIPEVEVGQYQCQNVGNPCYYLSKSLPRDVPRCVTNYDKVKQCDDFITEFQEFSQSVKLNITSSSMLSVQVSLESIPIKMEAVVFDPQDNSKIFSPANYECQPQVKQGIVHCQQQLKDIGNLQKFMVLLVSLNEEGFVLESRMQLYEGVEVLTTKSSTGTIVGAVFGAVFGLALLIGVAVYVVKKKKIGSTKNSSTQGAPTRRYDFVSTNDRSTGQQDA